MKAMETPAPRDPVPPPHPGAADASGLAQRLQAALGASYAVERPLGSGGFAVVFLVRDLELKRNLAVKVLSPDLVASKTVIERFRREAETVAQLSHPNIVPLHFIGNKDDLLYLAMACVDGGSLADRLEKEGRLPIDDACRVISEVAGALFHAHKRGVVHRDIKPQNVLIDAESGRCLVTDFGIARTADAGSLTATGMVLGTPAYLAPEQVTGEPSDHRADIFALGVMAYEMLAGRTPYEGSTPTAVMMKRLAGPPEPLTKVRPEVPQEVQDAVDGCLAVDPAERFQSAADVVRAIGGQTPTSGGHRTTQHSHVVRRRRRTWTVVSIVGVALLVGAGVLKVVGAKARDARDASSAPADSGMALIAAGEYMIGSDAGPASSRPAHRVRLAAFGIDLHEVTIGEYGAYVEAGKALAPWVGPIPPPALPVTRVLWSDATNFCGWKHKDGGRLPSEEEWEAAARGAEGRIHPWGAAFDLAAANTATARRNGPAPVGSFPRGATPEGIEDLVGNVWEWTASPMQAYPGGSALPASMQQFRVIRGGAFDSADSISTASFRGYGRPSTSPDELDRTGFRCAMSARLATRGR
jgi:formylglycine-generating enzyme required for sulfatase activity